MTNRLSDELEIRNVLAELLWQADNAPLDALDPYVACFTEDAEWEMFGDVRKGTAAIREGAEERRRSRMMGPGTHVQHFLSCTVVTFSSEDEAQVKSYIQAYKNTPNDPALFLMGKYFDEFRRTPAGWRLARRVVVFE